MFINISKGLKPIVLSVTIGSMPLLYNGSDTKDIINNAITANYVNDNMVNNIEVNEIISKDIFEDAYQKWKVKTMLYSFSSQIIGDCNFQKIISMGKDAIPFIIEKIRINPSPLVWALNIITGQKITNSKDITISEACKLWTNKEI